MATHHWILEEKLYAYFQSVSVREPELFRRLRDETASLPDSRMQISPEQGQFMALLVRLGRVRKALEIGTYTGYSALHIASALPGDGRLVCCDRDEETTAMARRYWREAGLAERIELRLGPALETLDGLLRSGEKATFDFAFIDADKESYDGYYERCLRLVRRGGLIVIDNVLWGGRVAEEGDREDSTEAIRAINRKIHEDARVFPSMVPIGDGLTLAIVEG